MQDQPLTEIQIEELNYQLAKATTSKDLKEVKRLQKMIDELKGQPLVGLPKNNRRIEKIIVAVIFGLVIIFFKCCY